ncbi:hypothetical protein GCM10009839_01100 [Catenulispora yoronensis]|uniref:WxL domain-containing protein n=1 Tax=Catenulispora yoronensis TaxID=450799 RepID=A0ABP5EXD5_9ACTN
MRLRAPRAVVVPLVTAAVVCLSTVFPADADTTGNTPLTVQVTSNSALSITVPTGNVTLGTVDNTAARRVSATLAAVTVNDNRNVASGWTAFMHANDFGDGAGHFIPASSPNSNYDTGGVTPTGNISVVGTTPPGPPLYPDTAVVTATATVAGINSATWTPTIGLNVPAGQAPGTYTSTLVHTVI